MSQRSEGSIPGMHEPHLSDLLGMGEKSDGVRAGAMTALERVLFSRTFEHPILAPYVEWVPTAWLAKLGNPAPSKTTHLEDWGAADEQVCMDTLFEDLLSRGMRDPFLVGVGRVTRRIRLEAGNQRVGLLLARGLHRVPAVAYVGDSCVTHLGNGSHKGQEMPMRLPTTVDVMGPYPIKEYMKLSEVLVSMPTTLADPSQSS